MREFDRDLLPPEQFQIMRYSERAFQAVGRNHANYFINELGLKPTDHVLEIGSGNGRIASALAGYLEGGSYTGAEIMEPFVEWCQTTYRHYPNFTFQHIDVYNKHYNPSSSTHACDFRFPFDDNTFDFIYLTSVFTHMHAKDVDNYLSEIHRMLKPGGTVFITYFLIDEATKAQIESGESRRKFRLFEEHSYTDNPRKPEAAIAFDIQFIRSLYERNKLKIVDVSLGKWRSPEKEKHIGHNQDRVVARKG
ncbi:class I SAM-dependent methyltransferase [Mangrovimicrobium sediminis]|nr:class I SAM-dependent methyltransferase [Haliea sp. SAOS-164]